jgi:hypothetical protein
MPFVPSHERGPQTFTMRHVLLIALLTTFSPAQAQTTSPAFGHPLAPLSGSGLWWCESTYKVFPDSRTPARPKTTRTLQPVTLSAARREREHVQLVFRPSRDPGPIQVFVSDLTRKNATIPARWTQIREVAYVRVTQPSDRLGFAGEWPDPLPSLQNPWRPKPGRNSTLWLTVAVPPDCPAGDYTGKITLRAKSWRRDIPLRLHVWDFSLPVNRTLRSAFGASPEMIRRYHNLKTAASTEKVWDLYMQTLDRSRLAPIDPMAIAPIRVSLSGAYWVGGRRDRSEKSVGEASLRVAAGVPNHASEARSELLPFSPTDGYRLSWRCKTTTAGQSYSLTVEPYDAARLHIEGCDVTVTRVGSGVWQVGQEAVARRLPPETTFVRLVLRSGGPGAAAWFDDVAFTRLSDGMDLVQDGGFELVSSLKAAMDFTDFDRAAKQYLDPPGFSAFRVPFEGIDSPAPLAEPPTFLGYEAETEEYQVLMAQYGRQLQAHLERMGWLDKAYVYPFDEPKPADHAAVRQGMDQVKRYAPRLKRLSTSEVQPFLVGAIDIWCPSLSSFDPQAAAERQRGGEEVWWRLGNETKAPYVSAFIDRPATDLRLWLWQTWKYGVQGIGTWETTGWASDAISQEAVSNPWEDPMSYAGAPRRALGNGAGHLFYPPNRRPNDDRDTKYVTGPVVSQRWENLADGVEDWEYFHLLDQLVRKAESNGDHAPAVERAKKLLMVPTAICKDLTHFTRDPKPLLAYRIRLAQAIEGMTARVK